MKKIGIVNFYKNDFPINLIKVLAELNDNVFLISCKDDYIKMIKESSINNWIFCGSNFNINSRTCPNINVKELLKLRDIHFLMIDFSMQNVLKQLGYKLSTCESKKDAFALTISKDHEKHPLFTNLSSPLRVKKSNTKGFDVKKNTFNEDIKVLSVYKNMLMTATFKNMLLTQWHPEHTSDGMTLIENWMK